MPASRMAASDRYGLHDGSGDRNSMRFALALAPVTGTRMHALRFRCEYTRMVGASYPGTRRRYELVVGAAKAHTEGA